MAGESILIVEDEGIIAMSLRQSLETMGYRVIGVADSGEDAVALALHHHPDLILMDVRLRGPMDGVEAAERVRAWLDVPVIFLTAYSDERTLERAKEPEPYGYLLKPYAEPDLRAAIEIALHRHAMLAERARAEAKFRAALESAPDAMVVTDPEGWIQFVNSPAERTFGYRRDELIGMNADLLLAESCRPQHREGRAACQAEAKNESPAKSLELTGQRKDTSTFPAEARWSPVVGTPERLIIEVLQDVSERRASQEALQRYSTELERSNQELGRFASMASHDLKAPLRTISSFLQLLSKRYGGKLDIDADELIQSTLDGARRMQHLIDDLIAYARVTAQGRTLETTDADLAVEGALKDLAAAIHESSVEVTRAPLPAVLADPVQLTELFQNLIGNAIKYGRKEGPTRIDVGVETGDASARERILFVRDNGIGIAPEYREQIFEPFARLHSVEYPGSGMGLAICRRIVERHGGRIWVDSGLGEGSTFRFTLPAGDAAQAHQES